MMWLHVAACGLQLSCSTHQLHISFNTQPTNRPPPPTHQPNQGWKDQHIASRLIPLYPRILGNSIEKDMQQVVDALDAAGCRGKHLRLIAWEVPKIFSRHTFRRYIRQFQALGVYGLSRDCAAGVSGRAVRATMMLHPFG